MNIRGALGAYESPEKVTLERKSIKQIFLLGGFTNLSVKYRIRFPEQGNMTFGMYGDPGIRYREYRAAMPFQGFSTYKGVFARKLAYNVSCLTSERYSCPINNGITLEDLLFPATILSASLCRFREYRLEA